MTRLLDRLRGAWDDLNDRERRLLSVLGAVAVAFVLGFPLFWTASENAEIEAENAKLREVLELMGQRRPQLQLMAEARRTASQRYAQRTPPLGSYLEEAAGRQSLSIREVTDQPEKSVGNYRRRSVTAAINEAGLTGIVNLLADIAGSPYPVAVESIQLEHYQPGDTYRFKIGVVTFDRQERKTGADDDKEARTGARTPSEG
jgi:type II secretory pathway component PulM